MKAMDQRKLVAAVNWRWHCPGLYCELWTNLVPNLSFVSSAILIMLIAGADIAKYSMHVKI